MAEPPRVTCIIAHPRPNSFTHTLADRALECIESCVAKARRIDLYAEEFDPVLSAEELSRRFSFDDRTQAYTRLVVESSAYVFVHPDWWGGPPAMLKGFIDRVFRTGIAFEWRDDESRESVHHPLLGGRRAVVLVASDADGPRTSIHASWNAVFEFCGIRDAVIRVFGPLHGSTLADRRRWLDEAGKVVSQWLCEGGNR